MSVTLVQLDQIAAEAPQVVTTPLSSADILALHTTPIEIAPAPGAGFINIPYLAILSVHNAGETPYANGGNPTIYYDSTVSADIFNNDLRFSSNPFSAEDDRASTLNMGILSDAPDIVLALGDNKPLLLKSDTAFITGTGTASITVYYNIVTIA